MQMQGATATYDVLGTPVSVVTPQSAASILLEWANDGQGRYVCVRDVHGVMRALDDPQLACIHRRADMITPDGMPIALIGKWRGLPVERTTGPDLMSDVMELSQAAGLKHYLYGGADGVAALLESKLTRRYPGLQIAGRETPPFRPISDDELGQAAQRINRSGAHFVWVGLSTPKQEMLMARLAPLTGATLLGVGAAFDVHSGRINRAPRWMQKCALEGVFRLICEPRRLWRRYLVLAPRFIALAAMQQWGLRKQ